MARKQTTIVRCDRDGCKEVAEVLDVNEAASGWLMVYTEKEHKWTGRNLAFEFCSEKCVGIWARERGKYQQEKEINRKIHDREEREEYKNHNGSGEVNVLPKSTVQETIEVIGSEPFKSKEIQDLSGVNQSVVDRHIKRMIESGELIVVSEGNGPIPRMFRKVQNVTQ